MRPSFLHAARTTGFVAWIVLGGAATSVPICQADAPHQAQFAGTANSTSTPAAGPWRLAFHQSGGFAGLDRQLELASTGELTASDRRRDTHVNARVTAEEIAQIDSLIPAAPAASPRPTGCADCLLYDVTLQAQERSVVVRLDDISLGRSGYEPLVKRLLTVLDRALTGRLKSSGN